MSQALVLNTCSKQNFPKYGHSDGESLPSQVLSINVLSCPLRTTFLSAWFLLLSNSDLQVAYHYHIANFSSNSTILLDSRVQQQFITGACASYLKFLRKILRCWQANPLATTGQVATHGPLCWGQRTTWYRCGHLHCPFSRAAGK